MSTITSVDARVGDRLRQLREARGWSQQFVSDRLGEAGWPMHQTLVSRVERGAHPVRVADLTAFARVFGAPANLFALRMLRPAGALSVTEQAFADAAEATADAMERVKAAGARYGEASADATAARLRADLTDIHPTSNNEE